MCTLFIILVFCVVVFTAIFLPLLLLFCYRVLFVYIYVFIYGSETLMFVTFWFKNRGPPDGHQIARLGSGRLGSARLGSARLPPPPRRIVASPPPRIIRRARPILLYSNNPRKRCVGENKGFLVDFIMRIIMRKGAGPGIPCE